jgi:hypothetical protein
MDLEETDESSQFYPPMEPNNSEPKIARLHAELESCTLKELETLNSKTPEQDSGFCNA